MHVHIITALVLDRAAGALLEFNLIGGALDNDLHNRDARHSVARRLQCKQLRPEPARPKVLESAALEAARSNTRGNGWAYRSLASNPGSAETPRAARCAP